MDIDVQWKESKLVLSVPGQPEYTLENVGGRKYKLAGAPDGFFATFKDKEMFLQQPQGDYTLPRIGGGEAPTTNSNAAKELIGKYRGVSAPLEIEIKDADGKTILVVPGQQPYTLNEKSKDNYHPAPLPSDFGLKVKRDAAGKIETLVMVQPQGELELKPIAGNEAPAITVDELYAKALEASGGEANWRKITSRVATSEIDLEQQGVKAKATSWSKAPNLSATDTTMFAVGKEIAKEWDFFDGTNGESATTFAPVEKLAGKRLEDTKLSSDLYGMIDWKSKYKSIKVLRIAQVGLEDAYAVEFEPEKGTKFTEYYSTKSFLLLKREGVITSSTSSQSLPYTVLYKDYRLVDGVMLPFVMVNNTSSNGNVVTTVKSVKHNVTIDNKLFAPRKLQ